MCLVLNDVEVCFNQPQNKCLLMLRKVEKRALSASTKQQSPFFITKQSIKLYSRHLGPEKSIHTNTTKYSTKHIQERKKTKQNIQTLSLMPPETGRVPST